MTRQFLLLDVDNTLYPAACGVVDRVDVLINRYLVERLGVPETECNELRQRLWTDYGTTLHGLMHCRRVDPDDYLRFVHQVDLAEHLEPSPALGAMLGRIALQKVAVTNGSAAHGHAVLARLGVRAVFFRVFGLEQLAYVPKPYVQAYHLVLASLHARGPDCVLVEDRPGNLQAARQLGMRTILVGDAAAAAPAADVRIGSILELESALARLDAAA